MFPWTTCHKSPIVSTAAFFLILNVWVRAADAACPGGSPPVFITQPGTNSALRLRHLTSEGLVVYLNGTEVYRYNASPGPVAAYSEALQNMTPDCLTVVNGLGLQYKTNLTFSIPWITVSNQANPFTLPPLESRSLFIG